jgi:hypothetical protein
MDMKTYSKPTLWQLRLDWAMLLAMLLLLIIALF